MKASLLLDRPNAPSPRWVRIAWVVLLGALFSAGCCLLLARTTSNWPAIWRYRSAFLDGWLLTIGISLAALVLSSIFGLLLALSRRSVLLPVRVMAMFYIELIRGSPLLVQILFFWAIVAAEIHFDDRLVAGILILSGFSAAYLAEIFRAGIESVGAS